MLVKEIRERFPIHFLVWNNDYQELENFLKEKKVRKIIELARFDN